MQSETPVIPDTIYPVSEDTCSVCKEKVSLKQENVLIVPGCKNFGFISCGNCLPKCRQLMREYITKKGSFILNEEVAKSLAFYGIQGMPASPEMQNFDFYKFGLFSVMRTDGTVDPGWMFGYNAKGPFSEYKRTEAGGSELAVFVCKQTSCDASQTKACLTKKVLLKELCEINKWDYEGFFSTLRDFAIRTFDDHFSPV